MSGTTELDRLQKAYGLRRRTRSFYSPSSLFYNGEVERTFIRLVSSLDLAPLDDKHILDVGTAGGYFLRALLKYGARAGNLYGVDLWHQLMREGREIVPTMNLACADAGALPFADGSFDIVVQQTMLSSVVDAERRSRIAREMLRVTRPGGYVFSFDFRFTRPGDRDVCPITRRELQRLFPDCPITLHRCGMLPQLVRFLAPRSLPLCALASLLWPIKTHYWAALRKA